MAGAGIPPPATDVLGNYPTELHPLLSVTQAALVAEGGCSATVWALRIAATARSMVPGARCPAPSGQVGGVVGQCLGGGGHRCTAASVA